MKQKNKEAWAMKKLESQFSLDIAKVKRNNLSELNSSFRIEGE